MLSSITRSWVALMLLLIETAHGIPVEIHRTQSQPDSTEPIITTDWKETLSNDTFHRLQTALHHLNDESDLGQAFRNDTIMRINIEREALRMPLIDLSQAFDLALPSPRRNSVTSSFPKARALESEEVREDMYLRSGTMTAANKRDTDAFDAEKVREDMYLRSGTMTMAGASKRSNRQWTDPTYKSLLNRQNLALGAYERVNIARRITGKSELTPQEVLQGGPTGTNFTSNYWQEATAHGQFWTTDQQQDMPNFIEGGQSNGYGFIQSTYHKLHCLANIRMILAWHITGQAEKMSQDMNAHTIHCLEYIRWRELQSPDLNEEPIDTVDYEGMGIH